MLGKKILFSRPSLERRTNSTLTFSLMCHLEGGNVLFPLKYRIFKFYHPVVVKIKNVLVLLVSGSKFVTDIFFLGIKIYSPKESLFHPLPL